MILKQINQVNNWPTYDSPTQPAQPATPVLQFSPTAWAKLLFLRDYGDTEVGGFGITASDDLLLVQDVQLVDQVCSWAHVAFDDDSVADFFDRQVDSGRRPSQFARIWVHSHPGDCPRPSTTDEETFARVFGGTDWAVMFILARQGQTYARLQFNVGPHGTLTIPVQVDYRQPFVGSDMDGWEQEYQANVSVSTPSLTTRRGTWFGEEDVHSPDASITPPDEWYDEWSYYVDESTSPPDLDQIKEHLS
jgi:proteasome lid subunit RPN8/RPN11